MASSPALSVPPTHSQCSQAFTVQQNQFFPWLHETHLHETHQWKLTSPPPAQDNFPNAVHAFSSCLIFSTGWSAPFLGPLQYSWPQPCLYGHSHHHSEKPSWRRYLYQLCRIKNKTTPKVAPLPMIHGGIRNQVMWENDYSVDNPPWVLLVLDTVLLLLWLVPSSPIPPGTG